MNPPTRQKSVFMALAMALLVFSSTWFYVRAIPLGEPPDEIAHLSYINDIAANGHWIPDYKSSTIIGSQQKNYLTHPPLYYSLLGALGKIFSWDSLKEYKHYRAASALFVALGIFFWVLAARNFGFNLIRTLPLVAAALAIPMFPYLAGSINNDNLCYLGIAVSFYGFSLLEFSLGKAAIYAATGFLITALTKATGTLFLVAFLGAWALMNRQTALSLVKSRLAYRAYLPAVAVCAAYYLYIIATYHTPFPKPGRIYAESTLGPNHMSLLQFVATFGKLFWERLPVVLTGQKSFDPLSSHLHLIFYFMICAPIVAWIFNRPFSEKGSGRKGADAFFIALLITVAGNFWVCWTGYLDSGVVGGIQPRYYSFLIPGIFFFSFGDGTTSPLKQWTFAAFSLATVVLIPNIAPRAAIQHHVYQRFERAPSMQAPDGTMPPSDTLAVVTPTTTTAGYFRIIDSNQGPVITGWSIDLQSARPSRAVWVSVKGKLVGTAPPGVERPDVAAALNDSDALYSGFVIRIRKSQEGIPPCDITLKGEQFNGTLADLINTSCTH